MSQLLGFCGLALLCALCFGCDESPALPSELERLPPKLTQYADGLTRTKLPHIAIIPVRGSTQPWESKLVGVPYYPKDRPWPTDVEGQPLVMLAQINFTENAASRRLSDPGHPIENSPIEFDEDYGFPALEEARLRFALESGYVRSDDYRFELVFGKAREKFFDFRIPALGELEDEYMSFNGGWRYGGRIGGYSRVERLIPGWSFPSRTGLSCSASTHSPSMATPFSGPMMGSETSTSGQAISRDSTSAR